MRTERDAGAVIIRRRDALTFPPSNRSTDIGIKIVTSVKAVVIGPTATRKISHPQNVTGIARIRIVYPLKRLMMHCKSSNSCRRRMK